MVNFRFFSKTEIPFSKPKFPFPDVSPANQAPADFSLNAVKPADKLRMALLDGMHFWRSVFLRLTRKPGGADIDPMSVTLITRVLQDSVSPLCLCVAACRSLSEVTQAARDNRILQAQDILRVVLVGEECFVSDSSYDCRSEFRIAIWALMANLALPIWETFQVHRKVGRCVCFGCCGECFGCCGVCFVRACVFVCCVVLCVCCLCVCVCVCVCVCDLHYFLCQNRLQSLLPSSGRPWPAASWP